MKFELEKYMLGQKEIDEDHIQLFKKFDKEQKEEIRGILNFVLK